MKDELLYQNMERISGVGFLENPEVVQVVGKHLNFCGRESF